MAFQHSLCAFCFFCLFFPYALQGLVRRPLCFLAYLLYCRHQLNPFIFFSVFGSPWCQMH